MQVLTVFREPLVTQHNVRCVIAQAVLINLGKTLMWS